MTEHGPDAGGTNSGGSHSGGSGPGGSTPGGSPGVGPLAVEAALLLDVVADRLAALKPDPDAGPAGEPAGERPPDGRPPGPDGRCPECGSLPGASCTACPLCRFLAMLRGERPETTARLVDGALLIVRTLRSLIPEAPAPGSAAGPAPAGGAGPAAARDAGDPPPPPPTRRGGFERIDIR